MILCITNAVTNMVDGVKMLGKFRRPRPQGAQDLGGWYAVFKILSILGVLTNVGIVGFTTSELDQLFPSTEMTTWTRLLFCLLLEHICFGAQLLVQYLVPDQPAWLREQLVKTDMINQILTEYDEYMSLAKDEEKKDNDEDDEHNHVNYSKEELEDMEERKSAVPQATSVEGLAVMNIETPE
jgi:hypothetical protein